MRSRITLALTAGVALAFLVLGLRAAWVASHLETGRSTLAIHWRDATLGWFVGKYQPVSQREPTDQADFWLRETERIVAANPRSAEIAMGAALLLDAPGRGFSHRYLTVNEIVPGMSTPELRYEAIARALDEFHVKTDRQCLALASRATELEPEDVRWWRLRALLHFRNDAFGSDEGSRSPAWSDVLSKCSAHDLDNALYDYLAARHLWEESAEIDWECRPERLEVEDSGQFSQGVECFQRGLKKGRFVVGQDMEVPIVLNVLARSRLRCTERDEAAYSRGIHLRTCMLARTLVHWQKARAHARVKSGDPEGAMVLFREALRSSEQYADSNEFAGFDLVARVIRSVAWGAIRKLADEQVGLVTDREREKIESRHVTSCVDNRVLSSAYQALSAKQGRQPPLAVTLSCFAWGLALPTAVALALTAAFGWLAAWCLGRKDGEQRRGLGLCRHSIAWMLGCGLSFVVLGLVPAGVISAKAQTWIAVGLAALAMIGFLLWVFRVFRRRRFQYSLREFFIVTLAVAVLFSLVSSLRIDLWRVIDNLDSGLPIPARGWEGLDAETLEGPVTSQLGLWGWVVVQWSAYAGMYVGLAASLLLVAAWQWARLGRAACGEERSGRRSAWKARWGATVRSVARSAATVAACFLFVYLALTPTVLESVDADHQQKMAYARDPGAYWANLRQEVDQLQPDPDSMQELRRQVEADLAREAELEAAIEQQATDPETETDADWPEADVEDLSAP